MAKYDPKDVSLLARFDISQGQACISCGRGIAVGETCACSARNEKSRTRYVRRFEMRDDGRSTVTSRGLRELNMGDIFRKIDICGLTTEGKRLRCEKGKLALVDTGTSQTVISDALSKKIRGKPLKGFESFIEGRKVPTKLTGITLQADNCEISAIVVAVDTALVSRAGKGPKGEDIDIVLGHDYLQRQKAKLEYVAGGDKVSCSTSSSKELGAATKKRKMKKKKRK